MMNETDFAALNEHLEEVRPIFDDFCRQHGFVYVDRKSLGRYPRIRIERRGIINIWFDLWMELDSNGNRTEQFEPDLPYELSAGAYVDVQDDSRYGVRFQQVIQCFSGMPFCKISAILGSEMEKHLRVMDQWDIRALKDHGKEVQLGS